MIIKNSLEESETPAGSEQDTDPESDGDMDEIMEYETDENSDVFIEDEADALLESESKEKEPEGEFLPHSEDEDEEEEEEDIEPKEIEYYNTFRGFDCEMCDYDYKHDQEAITLFKNHLAHLTDHDENSIEYLLSYFADIIQNPHKPPGIAILIKSPQGHGKDITIDIIEEMLSNKYMCRTEDIKDVLGTFNTAIKDKVVCVINELESKDGWEYRDKLKGIITTKTLNINEKGVKHYKQRNNLRVFIFSNRMTPIEVSQDDRRFVVFKSNFKKPTPEYFNKLGKIITNKDKLYTLYNYLKTYKINVNLRTQRPKTKAYEMLRIANISSVYRFVNELFVNDGLDDYFNKAKNQYKINNKLGMVLIQSQTFLESFLDYREENQLTDAHDNFKVVKKLLNDINITSDKKKIDGKVIRCYSFKKEDVVSALEPMKIEDDFETIEGDDWE